MLGNTVGNDSKKMGTVIYSPVILTSVFGFSMDGRSN